jgi:hypothetical protein
VGIRTFSSLGVLVPHRQRIRDAPIFPHLAAPRSAPVSVPAPKMTTARLFTVSQMI